MFKLFYVRIETEFLEPYQIKFERSFQHYQKDESLHVIQRLEKLSNFLFFIVLLSAIWKFP